MIWVILANIANCRGHIEIDWCGSAIMLSKFLSDHSTSRPPFSTTPSVEFHRRCHLDHIQENRALVVIWPRREDDVGYGNKGEQHEQGRSRQSPPQQGW